MTKTKSFSAELQPNTYQKIHKSQDFMQSCAWLGLTECISFGKPLKVSTIDIDTPGEVIFGDLCFRLTAGDQRCFIHYTPTINSMCHLWHFLEHIIIDPDYVSIMHIDQEGPEAILYVKPHEDKITLTILQDGWWEFSLPINNEKPYSKKVNLETNSITFNIEIPKKEFISKFYNALRSVKIPTAGVDYEDYWRGEQTDSDIIRKYCEE